MAKKTFIEVTQPSSNTTNELRVRRGRVDSVDLFEVKEHELNILENGLQADIYLNFAIFLFSLSFSAFLTLVSADFKKIIYETLALIILVVGFLFGLLLFLLWLKKKGESKKIIKAIKNRIPPDIVLTEDSAITTNEALSSVSTNTTQPQG